MLLANKSWPLRPVLLDLLLTLLSVFLAVLCVFVENKFSSPDFASNDNLNHCNVLQLFTERRMHEEDSRIRISSK